MKPVAVRSLPVALAALVVWAAVTAGCTGDRSAEPSPIPSTSSSAIDPAVLSTTTTAPLTATTILEVVGLDGLVTAIDDGAPATLDCFPSGAPDPTALCPPEGDEVLGTVTIDGTLVLVTEATEVQTCGPTDGPVAIAFEDAKDLFNHVTPLLASAEVVALPSGPAPGWARATRIFLGSCG